MKFSLEHFLKNTTLEASYKALTADKDSLLAKVQELETKVSDMDKTVAAFPGVKQAWETETATMKADHAKALEALKADYESKIAALNREVEATKVSVSNKVVNELASVGIQQGEVKQEIAPAMTAKEAYNKFVSFKAGPARTAFYNEHEKLILQGSHEK